MRLGQHVADDLGGGAGIDQIIDDQPALAVAFDTFQHGALARENSFE